MFKTISDFLKKFFSFFSFNSSDPLTMDETEENKENKIEKIIKENIYDENGKIDIDKTHNYIISILIYIFCALYIIIEVVNVYNNWPKKYSPTFGSVVAFLFILTYHIMILYNKNKN